MLNDLVENVIEIDFDKEINLNLPNDELFGLRIIKTNKIYEFIIKLSENDKNLIFFCKEDPNTQIIHSKSISSFLNQENKINNLNETIIKKEEKISKIKSLDESKINMLNDMIISKDSALISLTNKIEEINNENENLTSETNKLSKIIADKDSKIEILITDFNTITQEYETQIKKFKLELDSKDMKIDEFIQNKTHNQKELNEKTNTNKKITEQNNKLQKELNEKNIKNESLIEEINILTSTIEKNNDNIESIYKEIELLKEIISEKDETINSLKGGE